MNELAERLRQCENKIHLIWSGHCAGARCKEEHKSIWKEIQACLLEAAKQLDRRRIV